MTEPPPTARKASGWYGRTQLIASLILEHQPSQSPSPAKKNGITKKDSSRAVLWLNSHVGEDFEANAFPRETFSHLSHGIQLVHSSVCHHGNFLGPQVSEVHANLLRDAGTESNGRGCHLKGVLLQLLPCRCWRGIFPAPCFANPRYNRRERLMMAWVRMTWTRRRMCILNGSKQARRPLGSLWQMNLSVGCRLDTAMYTENHADLSHIGQYSNTRHHGEITQSGEARDSWAGFFLVLFPGECRSLACGGGRRAGNLARW